MSVLPEKGMSFADLEAELEVIKDRMVKDGVSPENVRVMVHTKGQLRPYDTYGFMFEEAEDDDGKIAGFYIIPD